MSARFRYGCKVRLKANGLRMSIHTVLADGTYICMWRSEDGVNCYTRFGHDALDPIAEVPVSALPPPKLYRCVRVHYGPIDLISNADPLRPVVSCENCGQVLGPDNGEAYVLALRMQAMVTAIQADALAHAANAVKK